MKLKEQLAKLNVQEEILTRANRKEITSTIKETEALKSLNLRANGDGVTEFTTYFDVYTVVHKLATRFGSEKNVVLRAERRALLAGAGKDREYGQALQQNINAQSNLKNAITVEVIKAVSFEGKLYSETTAFYRASSEHAK